MKVNPENLAALSGTQAGRVGETHGPDSVARNHRSGAPGAASGADRVELSSLAGALSRAENAHAAERTRRVEELAKAYRDGGYRIDARQVSHGIIAESLSLHAARGLQG